MRYAHLPRFYTAYTVNVQRTGREQDAQDFQSVFGKWVTQPGCVTHARAVFPLVTLLARASQNEWQDVPATHPQLDTRFHATTRDGIRRPLQPRRVFSLLFPYGSLNRNRYAYV